MADTGEFAINERVLVPHTDKHYEAKVTKAEYRDDGQWYYFLHYSGWNKKYDEWVEGAGLLKCAQTEGVGMGAPQGMPKSHKKLLKDKFAQKKSVGGPGGPEGYGVVQLDLDIPAPLKKALLEDYDAVVGDNKLVPLPRTPSVSQLLASYCKEAQESRGSSDAEDEVAHGLRTYFDKALLPLLLYRIERGQAQALLGDGRLPSSVYGCEHLLRLLVKLPELFSSAAVGEEALVHLGALVQDVMSWVVDNQSDLLLSKELYAEAEGQLQ